MAFAPSKIKKKRAERPEEIPLTSMMDTFTNILLFLLVNYSATGGLIQPTRFFELPASARDTKPKKLVSILVANNSATGVRGVLEDIAGDKEVRYLAPLQDLEDPNTVVLDGLGKFLDDRKKQDESIGKKFFGEITIQCDKDVPYRWLLKVINTCGQSEYGNLKFVVKRQQ